MYRILFKIIVMFTSLKYEFVTLYKPIGAELWGYSETSDRVYEIYVTNAKDKDIRGTFGFWVHDESLNKMYKKAFFKTCGYLKWSFKTRYLK